ncbi:hypothetical protein Lal_00004324 [Lupinus albus]|nr:hypothetical protein Lal_00004324 [Lupinus albus]
MQNMWLPRSICNDIVRMLRNFLWGEDAKKRTSNLVNWEVVTKNKNDGGIGIRGARSTYISLLRKLSWDMIEGSNKLWCKMLKEKYLRDCCMKFAPNKPSASPIWKSIMKTIMALRNGFSLQLVMVIDPFEFLELDVEAFGSRKGQVYLLPLCS